MSMNLNKFINVGACTLAFFLGSIFKIKENESIFKKKIIRFVIVTLIGSIILLKISILIQLILFFWLLSLNFSILKALLILLLLNLALMLVFIVYSIIRNLFVKQSISGSNLAIIIELIKKYCESSDNHLNQTALEELVNQIIQKHK